MGERFVFSQAKIIQIADKYKKYRGFLNSQTPSLPNSYLLTSVTITPFLIITAFGVNLAAEHVQAIAHVKHGIAVDAVVAGVTASVSIYPTLVVALLAKEVVEVQCHNKAFVLEERLRYLAVPDEFVGIR